MSPFIPAAATAKSAHGSPTRGCDSCQDIGTGDRTYDPSSSSVSLSDRARKDEWQNEVTSNLG